MNRSNRGQLVLLAAGALVVALVPILFATMQLGYHPDVEATAAGTTEPGAARAVLERTVHEVAGPLPQSYRWIQRTQAAAEVRASLSDVRRRLNDSLLRKGSVLRVGLNNSRARTWATRECPDGPNRQFGDCVADRGIVLQNRDGRAHLLAVTVDIRLVRQDGVSRLHTVLRTR